jgi:hypothetical protein
MDVSDLVFGIGGLAIGVASSLVIQELARYRMVMDQVCAAIIHLDHVSQSAVNELDLQFGYTAHFREATMQLGLMEQKAAKALLDSIVNDCGLYARDVCIEVKSLPAHDPQVVSFEGDRWRMIQCRCGFYHDNRQADWLSRLREFGPDWDGLMLTIVRGLGLHPRVASEVRREI